MRCACLSLLVFFALGFSQSAFCLDSQDPRWKALLRIDASRSYIRDPAFFLSPERTLQSELDQVVKSYTDPAVYCRFPARFLFVGERLKLSKLDFSKCVELSEFIDRAPMDRLELVFASENLTQASSIMGHVLLKISGRNTKGSDVEHALSFYTDIRDPNFLKLVFESLVVGKNGYFAMAPYADVKSNYLFREQRSLWEYEIELSEFDRKLLAFHLFELKKIEFRYFFHSYNCSTFVFDFLSVAHPELREDRGLWITPLDTIRTVYKHNLSVNTRAISSSKWSIRSLETALSPNAALRRQVLDPARTQLELPGFSSENSFLAYQLARSVNNYGQETGVIKTPEWRERDEGLSQQQKLVMSYAEVDISQFKAPARTHPDSALSLGLARQSGAQAFRLGLLPAAHALISDAREYHSEYELLMLAPTLLYETQTNKLKLDSLILYSVQAFSPSSELLPTVSGKFRLGWEMRQNRKSEFERGLFIEGGIGRTYRLLHDVDFYVMLNGGLDQPLEGFFVQSEFGTFVRQIFSMKTHISTTLTLSQHRPNKLLPQLAVKHLIPLRRTLLDLSLDFSLIRGEDRLDSYGGLSIHYLF